MDIQEIIKNRYKELPQDIQEAIKSTDLTTKFNTIAEKHNLHIDQNGALQTETILVMIGLEPSQDYISNLQRNLDIKIEEAQSIAQDVNNDILNSIKNSLKAMQAGDQGTGEATETTVEPPPVRLVNLITPTPPDHSAIEKAAQIKIETPIIQTNQYDNPINKDAILKTIETDHVPMIDHLLTTPTTSKEEVEVKVQPAKTIEKTADPSSDPYREQVV